MRIPSPPWAVPLVALGFLGGWLTASWVSPPTAATQERPVRVATPLAEVPMPRVQLAAVAAPRVAPAVLRNPFAFAGGRGGGGASASVPRVDRVTEAALPVDAPPDEAATSTLDRAAPWRVIGVATSDDGGFTAVVSGAGDVWLLAAGDQLPDGATVVEVGAAHLVLERAGVRETLRLP